MSILICFWTHSTNFILSGGKHSVAQHFPRCHSSLHGFGVCSHLRRHRRASAGHTAKLPFHNLGFKHTCLLWIITQRQPKPTDCTPDKHINPEGSHQNTRRSQIEEFGVRAWGANSKMGGSCRGLSSQLHCILNLSMNLLLVERRFLIMRFSALATRIYSYQSQLFSHPVTRNTRFSRRQLPTNAPC